MSSKKQTPSHKIVSSKARSATSNLQNGKLDLLSHQAALLQRASVDPSSLRPNEVLQLQRTLGNQAVGKLLAHSTPLVQAKKLGGGSTKDQVIQRVIHYNSKLFVHPLWWRAIQKEAEDQKFREGGDAIRDNLLAGIQQYLGEETTDIVYQNHSTDPDYNQLKENHTPATIGSQLSPFRRIYIYSDQWRQTESPFFHPRNAFVGKNDLRVKMNKEYVCTLIALIVQEGWPAVAREFELGEGISPLQKQVEALHGLLYEQRYDEALYQGANYKRFGYQLHPVGKPWQEVHRYVDLPAGEYIFSKTGHTMAVTVNQDLTRPEKKQQQNADPSWYTVKTNNIQTTSGLNEYKGTEKILNIFYK